MERRFLSLDFLRGVSIFGMIFSAIIPYGVLPAWMYHIQNPPPTHSLDVSVLGIGWVDLVFPVFIFCMGVSIPLSGKRKIEKGVGAFGYVKGCFERFFMLWLFSYLYVLLNFTTAEGVAPQFFTILGFLALFPLFMVIKKEDGVFKFCGIRFKSVLTIRLIGLFSVLSIIAIGHFWFGEVVGVHRRGIIIFLLAFLYLFGSLIWYFTRDSLGKRAVLFAVLFMFTHITRVLDWPAITYANPSVRWWFNMEYFYFLLVLIPATVVGDVLYRMLKNNKDFALKLGVGSHFFFISVLLFVVWQCYALYTNLLPLNIFVSVLYLPFMLYFAWRYLKEYVYIVAMGTVLLLWGLIMIYVEGGISKVPCTISYCFVTCAISIDLLIFSEYLCKTIGNSFLVKIFSGAGRSPLMSYIAYDNLLLPLLKFTGLIVLYRAANPADYPLVGVCRAALTVFLTMWIVARFVKGKIVWKA